MKKEVELYTNKNTKITSKGNRKKKCYCKMSAALLLFVVQMGVWGA